MSGLDATTSRRQGLQAFKGTTNMANTPLILHQYDISPFSQKAQKMMGLKGLSWQSAETVSYTHLTLPTTPYV